MEFPETAVIQQTVRNVLLQFAPHPADSVDENTDLVAELAYNSLAMLEAVFVLEEELSVDLVNDGTAGHMATVGDVERYVGRVLGEQQAAC